MVFPQANPPFPLVPGTCRLSLSSARARVLGCAHPACWQSVLGGVQGYPVLVLHVQVTTSNWLTG
jgi:hypothetical protein